MCPPSGTRRARRAALAVLLVVTAVTFHGERAAAAAGVYAPPVDAPVSDPFRPPPNTYAAGNRGLEYSTPPGTEVRASAPGVVTFAGAVGGTRHVVVLHEDGLRTSYSFLAEVTVDRGQEVVGGEVLGRSGALVHFGVRAGERYLDPALLLTAAPGHEVRLVPVEHRTPQTSGEERRGLVASLVAAGARPGAVSAARWLAGAGSSALDEAVDLAPRALRGIAGRSASTVVGEAIGTGPGDAVAVAAPGMGRVLRDVLTARARRRTLVPRLGVRAVASVRRSLGELLDDQRGCTPGSRSVPAPPRERRIAVLVAGYGSTGGDAEVLDVDTDALGYAPSDRVQFSYAGGRVAGVGSLVGVPMAPYGPADSMIDLRSSGQRLQELIRGIAAAHPGVPVDVIAHSQGGLVARQALAASPGAELPVHHLVTLGTPHHGVPGASVAAELRLEAAGSPLRRGLAALTDGHVDLAAPSVGQMVEGSPFLTGLTAHTLPADVVVTSVAAAGDLVVPALSSTLAGATNVLVPLGGPTAHGRLPGSDAVTRELALALGGAGPTCRAAAAIAGGVAGAAGVAFAEAGIGGAIGPLTLVADGAAAVLADIAG